MIWSHDRIRLEFLRYFRTRLPERLFMHLKSDVGGENIDNERWGKLGRLPRQLHDNPYWMMLQMGSGEQRDAYWRGYWYELDILSLLNHHLSKDDIFIDIGANIGAFTLHAAWLLQSSGQIIAFEPNPHLFKVLRGHNAINRIPNSTLHNIALGNKDGTIILQGCTDDTGFTTARPSLTHDTSTIKCEVPIRRGDDYLRDIDSKASGICKIDVEGFELEVLRGMTDFIENHDHFMYIIEITDDWLQQMGDSASTMFEFFQHYGFSAFKIDHRNHSHQILLEPISEYYQYNVLFKKV